MKKIILTSLVAAATSTAATITFDFNGDLTSSGSDAQVTVSGLTDLGNSTALTLGATQLDIARAPGNGPFGGASPQAVPTAVFYSFTITNNTAFTITLDEFTQTLGSTNDAIQNASIVDSSGVTVFSVNNNNTSSTPAGDFSIAGNTTDTYFIDFNSSRGTTNTSVDSLSFVVTPEPSSAALLGLGALALVARRRR